MESIAVLGLAPITDFVVTEHPLDVSERMLDFRPNLALDFLDLRLVALRVHLFALSRPFGNVPSDIPISMGITFFNASISGIAEHASFLAVQKFVSRVKIMSVGRSGIQAVNETGHVVDSNMQLHAEMPLVPFPGLVHLRIALLFLVLRRAGCSNDAGVDDAALAHHQTMLLQIFVDLREQFLAQLVPLEESTKVENGSLVRQ